MGRAGDQPVPAGWAGELVHLMRRLRMTSGADPTTGRPLSLRQIAQRSGYVPSHVRDVINGTGRPSPDAVVAVAGALSASEEDLRLAAFYAEQLRRTPAGRRADGASGERPRSPRPVPRELPHDVRGFSGREAQLAQLDALARTGSAAPGAVVISAIHGAAGVGKTALAVRFAHQVADRFPDGQLHANLRGFDPHRDALPPGEVLDQFLRSLGIDPAQIPAELDERTRLYRSVMAGKRMLLLLDNAASAEQVRPLLPGSHTCLALVTSRNRLSGLVAGDGAQRLAVDVLTPGEATDLIARIAGDARVTAEQDAAAELARITGYLPLALRIVAERLSDRPDLRLGDLVHELAVERDRLDVLSAGDDERMAVRSVFSWSYRDLPPSAARLFRLLGLHAGPDFSTGAAAALVDDTVADARRLLDTLTAVNLLDQTARDRYRFHDLVRVYAAERARVDEPDGERTSAVRRLLDWYLHTADAAVRLLVPGRWSVPLDAGLAVAQPLPFATYAGAVDWCEAERTNLVAATLQAADIGDYAIAWKLPSVLTSFFWVRKHWDDWFTTHHVGFAAARRLADPTAEAWILSCLGMAYHDVGSVDDAMDWYRPALERWRQTGERRGEAWVLAYLGVCFVSVRQPDRAQDLAQRALAIARDVGEPSCEGMALLGLASVYQHTGRHDDALDCSLRALPIWRAQGDQYGLAWSLHALGSAYRRLGRFEEAIEHCRRATAIRRTIGDGRGEAASLVSLGKALHETGDFAPAHTAWARAAEILESSGDPKATAVRDRLDRLAADLA
jgi:tetratricopeptide (TPR) repeat protein